MERVVVCTLCNAIEETKAGRVYSYRCSRCGECYACSHELIGYDFWICKDGARKPTTYDPGEFVELHKFRKKD